MREEAISKTSKYKYISHMVALPRRQIKSAWELRYTSFNKLATRYGGWFGMFKKAGRPVGSSSTTENSAENVSTLYSTNGDFGIKEPANPAGAELELRPHCRMLPVVDRADCSFPQALFPSMESPEIGRRHGHMKRDLLAHDDSSHHDVGVRRRHDQNLGSHPCQK